MRRAAALVFAVMVVTNAASAATTGVVDGLGGGGGRIQARIAPDTASIVRGAVPWVFYGANPEYGYRLRLARLGPDPSARSLDGAGGRNGRTMHSVGTDVSATVFAGTVHVFYRDETADALRHAWRGADGWSFQTLDGHSDRAGRTTNDVGLHSAAIVFRDRLHVFYLDGTTNDVRRAVFDGTRWRFTVLDGNGTAGGRTTASVGGAIRAGVWGSKLHVIYTREPSGLREAAMDADGVWSYATVTPNGGPPLALRRVGGAEVLIAYGGDGISAGRWTGTGWAIDEPVSSVATVTGLTVFIDDGVPFLAAGISECYGSGGCDRLIGVATWNGATFDDPYFGGTFFEWGEPPGAPSSAVTIDGVGHLFVGGYGFETEPDIYDHVLLRVEGPF